MRVEAVSSAGCDAVYNLSVEGQPEYFANGVLVHNCFWSFRGLLQRYGGNPVMN